MDGNLFSLNSDYVNYFANLGKVPIAKKKDSLQVFKSSAYEFINTRDIGQGEQNFKMTELYRMFSLLKPYLDYDIFLLAADCA